MFLFSFFNSLCIYYWGDFMFLILTVSHTSPTAEAAQCNCANVVLITANYQSRGRILHTALHCGITQICILTDVLLGYNSVQIYFMFHKRAGETVFCY